MVNNNKILVLIPARGGSKGIKRKNIKLLAGKPLIYYSIDVARLFAQDVDICVSTDDEEIIKMVRNYGLSVPFKRPESLATDAASNYDVILHAFNYYEKLGTTYDVIVYLQPTSPFRKASHIREAIDIYAPDIDMVVSVKETHANPYYVLFEENQEGFLLKSKDGNYACRQDCPKVWELNGAIYIINARSLKKHASLTEFKKIRKYIMDELYSVDIDTIFDWRISEMLVEKGLIALDK